MRVINGKRSILTSTLQIRIRTLAIIMKHHLLSSSTPSSSSKVGDFNDLPGFPSTINSTHIIFGYNKLLLIVVLLNNNMLYVFSILMLLLGILVYLICFSCTSAVTSHFMIFKCRLTVYFKHSALVQNRLSCLNSSQIMYLIVLYLILRLIYFK